ncbi:MAG TPA: multicopper oxidase domain-containing protein, partial [Candidatus Binataceae bacterium]|nr:multicopper oxidase domain-containing protein [Candidatus Binataceae bacterium]
MGLTISRRELFRVLGASMALLGIGGARAMAASTVESSDASPSTAVAGSILPGHGVAADPTRIPPPISRTHSVHHDIIFEGREIEAEIEPGAKFSYMTFNGQVPGPMIRVRQGDTIALTLRSDRRSSTWHSIDLHAVYGPGGGADPLTVMPGESKTIEFKTIYPGAFIYH